MVVHGGQQPHIPSLSDCGHDPVIICQPHHTNISAVGLQLRMVYINNQAIVCHTPLQFIPFVGTLFFPTGQDSTISNTSLFWQQLYQQNIQCNLDATVEALLHQLCDCVVQQQEGMSSSVST